MDILEQAKNINKKVKEGKIFGKYTQEEAKAKLGEMKKKNLKSNIKKRIKSKGGGMALRGLGRAFMKGGKE